MDAYSPMPIHGLAEAIGFRGTRLPLLVFIGGLTGCILAYLLFWSIETVLYPSTSADVRIIAGRHLSRSCSSALFCWPRLLRSLECSG